MLMDLVRKQPLVVFVLLTFIFSWSLWYFSGAYSEVSINFRPLSSKWFLAQMGTFTPAIFGGIISKFITTNRYQYAAVEWKVYILVLILGIIASFFNYEDLFKNKYTQAGLLLVTLITIISFANYKSELISSIFDTGKYNFRWVVASTLIFPVLMIVSMLITNGSISIAQKYVGQGSIQHLFFIATLLISFNLLFGGSLGEEPGWRGFALPLLLKKHGPVMASIILGVVWALYHAPIDIAHGFMLQGWLSVFARILWTIPLSLLFTFFFMRTNGNVLIAILLHTSINFSFDFFQPSNEAIGVLYFLALILFGAMSFLRG